jgi:RHS repeat-associated protein
MTYTRTRAISPTDCQRPCSTLRFSSGRSSDADLGLWLSEDPIGLSDGRNLYAYVGKTEVKRERYVD